MNPVKPQETFAPHFATEASNNIQPFNYGWKESEV